jgi:glucose/arabinose dehydrogenase
MTRLQKLAAIALVAMVSFAFTKLNNGSHATDTDPSKIYKEKCAGCHGERVDAFVDRQWKHGKTREELIASINNGYMEFGMPTWRDVLTPKEIEGMADLITESLKTVEQYSYVKGPKAVNNGPAIFKSKGMTVVLDTVVTGLESPWGFEQMPDGNYLITDRAGSLYVVDHNRNKTKIEGTPNALVEGQGGLLDVALHPNFAKNRLVYLSYSKYKVENNEKWTTTAVVCGKLNGNNLDEVKEIFEALPYTKTKHHYGSRLVFDKKGFLFISVGERGQEKLFPQDLSTSPGKIHRIKDDGSIPADNPFVGKPNTVASVYTYGTRNPQGMGMDPVTGTIWENEHGPRGGDELNIIRAGANYGWPVVCYGINYDGKPISPISEKVGIDKPATYWIPSIAPSGLTFVTGDKYPAWKGSILVGSLRFNFVDRCIRQGNKVIGHEKLLVNIGRTRNVEMGKDGYIYVAIENPGMVFRLKPVK